MWFNWRPYFKVWYEVLFIFFRGISKGVECGSKHHAILPIRWISLFSEFPLGVTTRIFFLVQFNPLPSQWSTNFPNGSPIMNRWRYCVPNFRFPINLHVIVRFAYIWPHRLIEQFHLNFLTRSTSSGDTKAFFSWPRSISTPIIAPRKFPSVIGD